MSDIPIDNNDDVPPPRPGRKKGKSEVKKSQAEIEIDEALESSALQEKSRKKRKRIFNLALMGVGAVLLAWLGYWLFAPFKGSMRYGICKVFLELNVRYPEELKLSEVNELNKSVRIWYSRLDAFGEYRMEQIQCYFDSNEQTGDFVSRVSINRHDVDQKIVDGFNKTLPVILAYPPDLTLPSDFPDNISDLNFQTDLFRKKIF